MATKEEKILVSDALAEEKFLGNVLDKHGKRLERSIQRLEDQIITQVKDLETTSAGLLQGPKVNLKQAQKVHKQLSGLFEKEYGTAVKSLNPDIDKALARVRRSYRKFGKAGSFTGIDADVIKLIREQVFAEFINLESSSIDAIAQTIYDSVAGTAPFSELKANIENELTGRTDRVGRPMVVHAQTWANTAMSNFMNQVHLRKGEQAGLTHFLYVGNIIATSRPFCIARAGKIYTKKQINSWRHKWQGKSGPALTHRGGWNCRHVWRPVDPEWFPEGQVTVGSFFTELGIKPKLRRRRSAR